jgi:DNA polymerase family A
VGAVGGLIFRADDTETLPITDQVRAPPLVCLSTFADGETAGLYSYRDSGPVIWSHLADPSTIVEGHNFCGFDIPVLIAAHPEITSLVFEAAANGRIRDTMLEAKIIDLAFGAFRGQFEKDGSWTQHNYGLADLSWRYLKRRMVKGEESWQMRFREIREVPVAYWPADARDYAIGDAIKTRGVRAALQAKRDAFLARTGFDLLVDSPAQSRAAIWLGLMQTWGIRIDVSKMHILEAAILEDYKEHEEICQSPYDQDPCPAMVFIKPVKATKKNPLGTPGYTYQCSVIGCKEHGLIRPNGKKDTRAAKDYMIRVMREAGRLPKISKGGLEKIQAASNLPDLVPLEVATARIDKGKGESFQIIRPKVAEGLMAGGGIPKAAIIDYLQEEYIALDKEACEDADDEVLDAYAALTKLSSVLSKDVPRMRCGRIHPDFNSLLRTGRTSARGYNVQNPSRKGGVRECFIPDPGYVFAMIDLDGAELRGMAQVCLSLFGWSKLADALNAGKDPHLMLGANLVGKSYDETLAAYETGEQWAIDARQMAKVGNFGFAGGMGAKKFRIYAKASYGMRLTLEQVQWLKAKWLETWPEFHAFFRLHGDLVDFPGNEGVDENGLGALPPGAWFVEQSSGRMHAGLRYSQACNLRFQGLIATAFKASGWDLCRACYDPTLQSILFGSRPVNEIHDEHILEVPEPIAHECAEEMGRLVIRAVSPFLPGVPPTAKPLLTRCWSKAAFPIKVNGRHIPWDGHKKDKATGRILQADGTPLDA